MSFAIIKTFWAIFSSKVLMRHVQVPSSGGLATISYFYHYHLNLALVPLPFSNIQRESLLNSPLKNYCYA